MNYLNKLTYKKWKTMNITKSSFTPDTYLTIPSDFPERIEVYVFGKVRVRSIRSHLSSPIYK